MRFLKVNRFASLFVLMSLGSTVQAFDESVHPLTMFRSEMSAEEWLVVRQNTAKPIAECKAFYSTPSLTTLLTDEVQSSLAGRIGLFDQALEVLFDGQSPSLNALLRVSWSSLEVKQEVFGAQSVLEEYERRCSAKVDMLEDPLSNVLENWAASLGKRCLQCEVFYTFVLTVTKDDMSAYKNRFDIALERYDRFLRFYEPDAVKLSSLREETLKRVMDDLRVRKMEGAKAYQSTCKGLANEVTSYLKFVLDLMQKTGSAPQ